MTTHLSDQSASSWTRQSAVAGPPSPPRAARLWARWLVSFVGFPLGGLPAVAVGGVDDPATAVLGGLAAGLVVGGAQGLVWRRAEPGLGGRWTVATGLGLCVGLLVGSAVVDYSTSASALAIQGLVSGLGVGLAQAVVLHRLLPVSASTLWLATVTLLWPLGWTVTRLVGVSVGDQFAVFGASGAVVYSALSGLVLLALLRTRRPS